MILLCDFNPKIVRGYRSVNFTKNISNSFSESRVYTSGNGLDICYFLKSIGENPKLITYLGGENGELIKEKLREDLIDFDFIDIKDNNEEVVLIKSINLKTTLKSPLNRKTLDEEERFFSLFSREIENKDIVALSTFNEKLESISYNDFINTCYKKGIKVAVATDDMNIIKESKPYIMIINKESLEDYTCLVINNQDEVVKAGGVLISNGIGILIVNSEKGTVILNGDRKYRADFSKLSDYITKFNLNLMLAGIVFGINRSYDFETAIKVSMASYLVENYVKFRNITMADIKGLMKEIKLYEI
ncbi:PfkB family carbohydrate kinase [Peptoniphilus catoniae]|uniref:PfkB family carbohydrate kinase n=1 Tax=Peptoniphilus catoniae TaxID=1660341 RepID=UPI0010FD713E|nr:PfkB family carbohydrate kinase [Peptoniphilus catoniae]